MVGTRGSVEVVRGGWLAGPFEFCVASHVLPPPQDGAEATAAGPAPAKPVVQQQKFGLTGVQVRGARAQRQRRWRAVRCKSGATAVPRGEDALPQPRLPMAHA